MKTMFKCENGNIFCPANVVCVKNEKSGKTNDGLVYRWAVFFDNRIYSVSCLTQADYERFVKWMEGSQIKDMFMCEDGTIVSVDNIVYLYNINVRPYYDGDDPNRYPPPSKRPWEVVFDDVHRDNHSLEITQADYGRLVKMLEEKGVVV